MQTFHLCPYRTEPGTQTPMPDIVPTQQYDWTYTTTYSGHSSEASPPDVIFQESQDPKIPSDRELTRPDPFLFYAQSLLFEDELHDNGSSSYLVRLVSNHSFAYFLPLLMANLACHADLFLSGSQLQTTC